MNTEVMLYWIIAANLIGFILMVWDKHCAENGGWRISESMLIRWSMMGGSLGTLAAQRLIRHKTRKQPIAAILTAIPLLHAALLALSITGILPAVMAP